MRTTFTVVISALLLLALSSSLASAQEHKEPAKPAAEAASKLPMCPIMDDPIDVTVKIMTDQGPVYFCCDGCIKKYEKEPAKYAEKVTAQRAVLAKLDRVQVSCPLDGKPLDGKSTASVGGKTIGFCCTGCAAKYEKEPAAYAAKLENSYTYQTQCPVGGEKIDPAAFVDLATGQRIYLCCAKCGEKLSKDPAAFAPKLAAQGVHLDIKKLTKP